ncbi:MAG: pantetheine-phosphate adenylyltransferase [Bacteroidales bacterium]|nr:pantetheine-phosphate adenylyltransferase [Bacteroidales bacterium]
MDRIAVFPGTFDPITIGHEATIRQFLPLFDKIYVAIGNNPEKKTYFPLKKRLEWLKIVFEDEPKIEVDYYNGLTVDFCKQKNARYILRGLRTSEDFEYERRIAQVNRMLSPEVEVLFILTKPEHTSINSGVVREIHRSGGDISQFVPAKIVHLIQTYKEEK